MHKSIALGVALTLFFLARPGLHAEEERLPTATVNGFSMMQGDDELWGTADFDSSHWPTSSPVMGTAFNRVLIPDTIGWLRTQPFPLPASFADSPMALYFTSGASFEVWWNGVFIGSNGQPAATLAGEIEGLVDSRFYIPPSLFQETDNVLALRYSALGYSRLHLPLAFAVHIGPYQDQRYNRLARHVPALLLLGAVGAASLFFGVLYFRRRVDKGSLWLALMFLMVTFQSAAEILRALFSLSYMGAVARILLVAIFAYGSGLFLNLFTLTYLRLQNLKRWTLLISHALVLTALMFSYNQFDRLTFALIIIFVFSAMILTALGVRRGRAGALPLLLVLIVFCCSFLVGYSAFLDSYYYAAMALLAGTLFVVQANAISRTERRSVEEKLKSNRLQLELLKRQIQPHFIMNTLTALSEWILTSPESSVDMINALADEFRILNGYSDRKLVPLESEIELCRAHLTIMSYRQNRSLTLDTSLQNTGLTVPPAIFHTLIENALTHNQYTNDNSIFTLTQRVTESGDLEFTLITPVGTRRRGDRDDKGGGMGLSYVRIRLQEVWPDSFTLTDGEDEQGRWKTSIVISAKAING